MRMRRLCPALGLGLYAAAFTAGASSAHVDDARNWYTAGRDLEGTYYSPLTQINAANVKRLGFAWQFVLDGRRGQEATPIVIDGIMYTSGSWGYVYAVNAATGKKLWRYDPKPDFQAARNACCDLVNRGVAVQNGIVYVVSIDGGLHALEAANGSRLWYADTIAYAAVCKHRCPADGGKPRRHRQQRVRHGSRRRSRLRDRLRCAQRRA
jgi:quinohemoprotein ethanol dehydrogenase